MRRRSTHYVVAIVFTSACGGGTPSSPASPTATTWTLAGTVRDAQDNTALASTTVVILDGPNANRTATTNSSGSYSLQNLQPGGFTVQFTRADYDAQSIGVTVTQNTMLNVMLMRTPLPTAQIVTETGGAFNPCSESSGCVFNAPMRNIGVGCAREVRGTMTFFDSQNQQVGSVHQWTHAPVVRPNEAFVVLSGSIPFAMARASTASRVDSSWTSVRCP